MIRIFQRGCSVCAKKRDKLYVGECMALTIGLRGMFGLCTFDSPYNLSGRGFVDFDLILLGMLFFSTRILVFCAIVLDGSLSSFLYALSERRFFTFFLYYSDVFMITVVLLLLVENTMMSVSLFRF